MISPIVEIAQLAPWLTIWLRRRRALSLLLLYGIGAQVTTVLPVYGIQVFGWPINFAIRSECPASYWAFDLLEGQKLQGHAEILPYGVRFVHC